MELLARHDQLPLSYWYIYRRYPFGMAFVRRRSIVYSLYMAHIICEESVQLLQGLGSGNLKKTRKRERKICIVYITNYADQILVSYS